MKGSLRREVFSKRLGQGLDLRGPIASRGVDAMVSGGAGLSSL